MNREYFQLLTPFLSFAVTFLMLFAMLKQRKQGIISNIFIDVPNERSLHSMPIPRFGGIAIMTGITIASLALPTLWWVLTIAISLAVLSAVDDFRGLSPFIRLAGHFACSFAFSYHILAGCLFWQIVLSALCVSWMTNLFNFMDGSDGLAGGMGLLGFLVYGICAFLLQETALFIFCMSISAACLGFLCFNFSPAKVFMGDAGSVPLGFLAAAIGIIGTLNGIWGIWLPIVVFSPFIVDATVTLMKRMLRGERLWVAHKQHYYQRLIQMGISHKRTAFLYYTTMAICGTGAVLAQGNILAKSIFFPFIAISYLILMALVDKKWSYLTKNKPNNTCK